MKYLMIIASNKVFLITLLCRGHKTRWPTAIRKTSTSSSPNLLSITIIITIITKATSESYFVAAVSRISTPMTTAKTCLHSLRRHHPQVSPLDSSPTDLRWWTSLLFLTLRWFTWTRLCTWIIKTLSTTHRINSISTNNSRCRYNLKPATTSSISSRRWIFPILLQSIRTLTWTCFRTALSLYIPCKKTFQFNSTQPSTEGSRPIPLKLPYKMTSLQVTAILTYKCRSVFSPSNLHRAKSSLLSSHQKMLPKKEISLNPLRESLLKLNHSLTPKSDPFTRGLQLSRF